MTPSRYALLLLVVTTFAALAVAQRACKLHLGYSIERSEAALDTLTEENRQLLCETGALANPARIEEKLGRFKIALVRPEEMTKVTKSDGPGVPKNAPKPARH